MLYFIVFELEVYKKYRIMKRFNRIRGYYYSNLKDPLVSEGESDRERVRKREDAKVKKCVPLDGGRPYKILYRNS